MKKVDQGGEGDDDAILSGEVPINNYNESLLLNLWIHMDRCRVPTKVLWWSYIKIARLAETDDVQYRNRVFAKNRQFCVTMCGDVVVVFWRVFEAVCVERSHYMMHDRYWTSECYVPTYQVLWDNYNESLHPILTSGHLNWRQVLIVLGLCSPELKLFTCPFRGL